MLQGINETSPQHPKGHRPPALPASQALGKQPTTGLRCHDVVKVIEAWWGMRYHYRSRCRICVYIYIYMYFYIFNMYIFNRYIYIYILCICKYYVYLYHMYIHISKKIERHSEFLNILVIYFPFKSRINPLTNRFFQGIIMMFPIKILPLFKGIKCPHVWSKSVKNFGQASNSVNQKTCFCG